VNKDMPLPAVEKPPFFPRWPHGGTDDDDTAEYELNW
jgi:hypothetical protein